MMNKLQFLLYIFFSIGIIPVSHSKAELGVVLTKLSRSTQLSELFSNEGIMAISHNLILAVTPLALLDQ